jgi:three-Cys-motif partner protein
LLVTSRARRFFSTHREWQWIKHLILADYLRPWAAKVGYRDRAIFVVDAFAGAGSYLDPETGTRTDGSPVIAARRALEYQRERPGKVMRVLCVEQNPANRRALEQRVSGFGDLVEVFSGAFADNVTEIAQRIGSAPALVLLDPFGIKGIDAVTCQSLLHRIGKTDVFVIAGFAFVHRTGGQLDETSGEPRADIPAARANVATVDAFFGTRTWRSIALGGAPTAQRERGYLQLYFDVVLGDRFAYKLPYPVRRTFDAPPRYWIVHASDYIDAAMLMNNEMVKVDRELYLRTFDRPGTIPGFAEAEYEAHTTRVLANLEADVLAAVNATHGIRFAELRSSLLDDYFGRVKEGAYSNTVKALARASRIQREKERWNARLDDDELISPAT